jgi:muramidase (phage lysozyme)
MNEIQDVTPPKNTNTEEIKTLKVASLELEEVEIKSTGKIERMLLKTTNKLSKAVSFLSPITSLISKLLSSINEEKKKVQLQNNLRKEKSRKGNILDKIPIVKSVKEKVSGLSAYNRKRNELDEEKHRDNLLKENEKQTTLLQRILNNSGDGKSSGWLSSLLKLLFSSWIGKVLTALVGLAALLKLKSLGSSLPSKGKKTVVAGKDGKGKKGAVASKSKLTAGGILKKAGVVGGIVSAVSGISDYKEWKGLSEEHKTTLREKIVGALGGIANGFNDFVNFISFGTVDLFNKNQAFEVIDNVTSGITQAFNNMLSGFPTLQASINVFTNGVNDLLSRAGEGFTKAFGWIKEFARSKSEDEKKFVEAMEKRESIEEEYEEKKYFGYETDSSYYKRRRELKTKLDKAKEEELKYAELALENKDFVKNSRFGTSAVVVVNRANKEIESQDADKYVKWKTQKNKIEKEFNDSTARVEEYKKRMTKENMSTEEEKGVKRAFDFILKKHEKLTKELEKLNKSEPKVRRYRERSIADYGGTESGGSNTLLDVISKGEGSTLEQAKKKGYSSEYDVTLGYGQFADDKSKPLTEMTIKEVYQHQQKMKQHKDNKFKVRQKDGSIKELSSSAVGKWQIVEPTLRRLQKKLGISEDDKFSPEIQDRMAMELLNERGLNKYLKGEITKEVLQKNIAKEWASMPSDSQGMNSGNIYKTEITHKELNRAIESTKVAYSKPNVKTPPIIKSRDQVSAPEPRIVSVDYQKSPIQDSISLVNQQRAEREAKEKARLEEERQKQINKDSIAQTSTHTPMDNSQALLNKIAQGTEITNQQLQKIVTSQNTKEEKPSKDIMFNIGTLESNKIGV